MNPKKSKVTIIHDYFKNEIELAKYAVNDILPSETEVAETFETSRPTVAKAFNMLKDIGYIDRKAGFGTYVIYNPESKAAFNYKFGMLIPHMYNTEIYEPICGEIASLGKENNFSIIINEHNLALTSALKNFDIDEVRSIATQIANSYVQKKVNGVFMAPFEHFKEAYSISESIYNIFKKADIPIVYIDSDYAEYPSTSDSDLISLNQIEAGFQVTKHLIEEGCKSFVFVNGKFVANTITQRLIGVRLAIEKSGLPQSALHEIVKDDDPKKTAKNILCIKDRDSLICYNDAVAAYILPSLINEGVKIPEEIKVIAFDDVEYAKLFSIPLSSYVQPCREIALRAANTMLLRIKNPTHPNIRLLVKGHVVPRQSTRIK